ncbi:MAG: hypothetical protein ACE149_10255 [Armatimonadota bacterium]
MRWFGAVVEVGAGMPLPQREDDAPWVRTSRLEGGWMNMEVRPEDGQRCTVR